MDGRRWILDEGWVRYPDGGEPVPLIGIARAWVVAEGALWVADDGGVVRIRDGRGTRLDDMLRPPVGLVRFDGQVWAADRWGHMVAWPEDGEHGHRVWELPLAVDSLAAGERGVWIAAGNGGLWRLGVDAELEAWPTAWVGHVSGVRASGATVAWIDDERDVARDRGGGPERARNLGRPRWLQVVDGAVWFGVSGGTTYVWDDEGPRPVVDGDAPEGQPPKPPPMTLQQALSTSDGWVVQRGDEVTRYVGVHAPVAAASVTLAGLDGLAPAAGGFALAAVSGAAFWDGLRGNVRIFQPEPARSVVAWRDGIVTLGADGVVRWWEGAGARRVAQATPFRRADAVQIGAAGDEVWVAASGTPRLATYAAPGSERAIHTTPSTLTLGGVQGSVTTVDGELWMAMPGFGIQKGTEGPVWQLSPGALDIARWRGGLVVARGVAGLLELFEDGSERVCRIPGDARQVLARGDTLWVRTLTTLTAYRTVDRGPDLGPEGPPTEP